MGEGNYGGNGSVHWSIDHEDHQDLKVKNNTTGRPKKTDPDNVHVKTKALGRDGKNIEFFDVTVRFEQQQNPSPVAQLTSALQQALAASPGTSFFVTFRVPATVNGTPRSNPDEQLWPDVRVRW